MNDGEQEVGSGSLVVGRETGKAAVLCEAQVGFARLRPPACEFQLIQGTPTVINDELRMHAQQRTGWDVLLMDCSNPQCIFVMLVRTVDDELSPAAAATAPADAAELAAKANVAA